MAMLSRSESSAQTLHQLPSGRLVRNVGRYKMIREENPEGLCWSLSVTMWILENLSAIGVQLTLITNGTELTPKLVERLGRLPLAISVSLDTLDREQERQIRGADQLPRIALLKELPHRVGLGIRSRVTIDSLFECA